MIQAKGLLLILYLNFLMKVWKNISDSFLSLLLTFGSESFG
jgi:hypothetical protein